MVLSGTPKSSQLPYGSCQLADGIQCLRVPMNNEVDTL